MKLTVDTITDEDIHELKAWADKRPARREAKS